MQDKYDKALCRIFKTAGVRWLPYPVRYLFLYLLDSQPAALDGDILFVSVSPKKITLQLLTVIADKPEIIMEKPAVVIYDDATLPDADFPLFLQPHLISYGINNGLYHEGSWEINMILFSTDNETLDLSRLDLYNEKQLINRAKIPNNIEELIAKKYCGQIFPSISMVYPWHFYIEKKGRDSAQAQMDLIPFDTDSLALDLSQRYKIFSFAADSKYNLADSENCLQIRVYRKFSAGGLPQESITPELFCDQKMEISSPQSLINLYINLPCKRLEVDYADPGAGLYAAGHTLMDLQKQQESGYDFIRENQLGDSQLLSDFGLHLEQLQNMPVSSQVVSKTVYFRALLLLSVLTGKKQ